MPACMCTSPEDRAWRSPGIGSRNGTRGQEALTEVQLPQRRSRMPALPGQTRRRRVSSEVFPGCSPGVVFALQQPPRITRPDGQKLADALTGGPPRRPPQNGSFLMRHGQMAAEVALAFRRAARAHPGHELIEWECDWAAAMKLGSGLVVPDARIVYQTRHWEFSAFLEVDLATEGTRFFARKIGRYLDLYLDRSWRKQLRRWP